MREPGRRSRRRCIAARLPCMHVLLPTVRTAADHVAITAADSFNHNWLMRIAYYHYLKARAESSTAAVKRTCAELSCMLPMLPMHRPPLPTSPA